VTFLEKAGSWIASLDPAGIPGPVLDEARLQVMSVVAAIHHGARSRSGAACSRVAAARGGTGGATLLGAEAKASPREAVLLHAALSMVHDFDDYVFLAHTGHSAVAAALAVAEQEDASLSEMLAAQVAANEVAGRLGAYVAVGPRNGQMWSHVHLAAAAAAASRLRGLDAEQTTHALAHALGMPPTTLRPAFFGSQTKVLTAALPAAAGLTAADLAGAGLRGRPDVVEHERGLGGESSYLPLAEVLGGLGEAWVTSALSCKIHPGCAYAVGPVAAALRATEGRGLEPRRIRRVEIASNALTTTMERLCESNAADVLDPVAVSCSARRSVAVALLEGGLAPSHLDEKWMEDNRYQVQAVTSRVRLHESRPLTMDLLWGMSEGIDLPALLKKVGLTRLWKVRGRLRSAYSEAMGERPPPRRRSWRELSPWSSSSQGGGDTLSLLGEIVKKAAGGAPFEMAACDFSALELRLGAEVTVETEDGRRLEGAVRIPPGVAGLGHEERRRDVAGKLRDAVGEQGAAIVELLDRDPAAVPARDLAEACLRGGAGHAS
jgi:2-methylcitrate dehydratase PrpD